MGQFPVEKPDPNGSDLNGNQHLHGKHPRPTPKRSANLLAGIYPPALSTAQPLQWLGLSPPCTQGPSPTADPEGRPGSPWRQAHHQPSC